jgi:hypothetical protein
VRRSAIELLGRARPQALNCALGPSDWRLLADLGLGVWPPSANPGASKPLNLFTPNPKHPVVQKNTNGVSSE